MIEKTREREEVRAGVGAAVTEDQAGEAPRAEAPALTASGPEEHLNLPLDPSPQPSSRATSLGLTGDWETSNCSAFFGIRKKSK